MELSNNAKKANITLFPSIEDVFTDVTDNHKAVFFPLLTIDLKSIDKGNGKVFQYYNWS